MNFSKENIKFMKIFYIKRKEIIFDKENFSFDDKLFLHVKKLNNNRILCYYFECLESKDNPYLDPYYGKCPYKYNFMFYKYNNKDLILEYQDIHTLTNFSQNILPYEDSFFLYGNSGYYFSSNSMVVLYFLYFYKNKKMNCLKDGIENNQIQNCIIFNKKYLIILLNDKIEKYIILDNDITFISEFNINNADLLMENKYNIILMRKENKDYEYLYLYFLEVNENFQKTKEERIILTDFYFKDILFYNKKLYILSNNCSVYY